MTSLGAVLRLVVLRARHDRTVLAGAAVIVLLATSLIAAGLIYADAVASAGLHRTLADAPPASSGIEIGAPLRVDRLEALDSEVRTAAAQVFGQGGAAVTARISSASFALPSQPGDEVTELAVFRAFEELEAHASLVSGAWPEAAPGGPGTDAAQEPVEAVLVPAAANELGLAIGDALGMPAGSRTSEKTISGYEPLLEPEGEHRVPPALWEQLRAHLGA